MADLGFSTDIISETIVSTYNSDGPSNAATNGRNNEGFKSRNYEHFDSSLTYQNLSIKKQAL
jgi:hypothetical protein